MTANWLQAYLDEAVSKRLCVNIHCTTCGTLKFREGVLDALARATGQQRRQHIDWESRIEIAKALAEVTPDGSESWALEEAVRYLLVALRNGIPLGLRLELVLAESWAGHVLDRMKEHHAGRNEERRERAEFQRPANVQTRREEKKRLKQEQHHKRLVLKKERDRLWREHHEKAR